MSRRTRKIDAEPPRITRMVDVRHRIVSGPVVEWLMGWPLGWTSTEPMQESTWAAWQQAFRSDPIASGASGTDRSRLPL